MINLCIIERAKNGNKDAFILVYNTYRHKVYNTAYFILKDYHYAEDVVQDTFLQVNLNIHKLHAVEAFETWLYKITVNHCLKLLKKIKKSTAIIEFDENIEQIDEDELHRPENIIIQREMEARIMSCIYSLAYKHRIVLTLYYFNNMSIKDIAYIVKCSEGTIKSRLFYGKKILKGLLDSKYNINCEGIIGGATYEA